MATKQIVLIAKHIANQNRIEPNPLKIGAKTNRLADELLTLIGGVKNLSTTDGNAKPITASKIDLAVLFSNNIEILLKIAKSLAVSVGSIDANEYVLHLSHNEAYTGDKHIGRHGCGNITALAIKPCNEKFTDDEHVMIEVLLTDIINKLRNCYWHQSCFMPF